MRSRVGGATHPASRREVSTGLVVGLHERWESRTGVEVAGETTWKAGARGTRGERGIESARRQMPIRSKSSHRSRCSPALPPRPLFLHAATSSLLHRTVTLTRSEAARTPSGAFVARFGKPKWLKSPVVNMVVSRTASPAQGASSKFN